MANADEQNPFAPPQEREAARPDLPQRGPGNIVIEGKRAFAPNPAQFPPGICIKCGAVEDEETSRLSGGRIFRHKLHHCSPWVYLLLFVGIVVLLIVYLIVRKPCRVSCYLCGSCKAAWRRRKLVAGGILIGGVAAIVGAIVLEIPVLGVIAALLILIGLMMSLGVQAPLRVAGYEAPEFAFKGFSPAFVAAYDRCFPLEDQRDR